MRRWLTVVVALCWLGVSLLWMPPAVALPSSNGLPTVVRSIEGQQVQIPDWGRITFSMLPPILGDGEFLLTDPEVLQAIGYDPSRVWRVGMRPESLIMLGDVSQFTSLGQLSLNQIASGSGTALELLTLDSFGLIPWQTPASLVQAIPDLGSLTVGSVEPIRDLVLGALVSGNMQEPLGDISAMAIAQLVDQFPALGNLPLGHLQLTNYALNSIPGLTDAPLQTFAGSGQVVLDTIPGLPQLPLNQFLPDWLMSALPVMGKADLMWGPKESGKTRTITGGTAGDVFAALPCQTPCPHIELTEPEGEGPLRGQQWIAGPSQPVPGGKGPLRMVNDGMEPTGIKPWPATVPFKLVVETVDEATGSATFAWYMQIRVKTVWGETWATPHFLGPFPAGETREKGIVLASLSAPPAGIELPGTDPQLDPEPDPLPELEPPLSGTCDRLEPWRDPLPGGFITSRYGWRRHPISGEQRFHAGIDEALGGAPGAFILAGNCGRVVTTGVIGGYGYTVEIQHPRGGTLYAHLHPGTFAVRQGEEVRGGQRLARQGATGRVTGPHLHFEWHHNGLGRGTTDPCNLPPYRGYCGNG